MAGLAAPVTEPDIAGTFVRDGVALNYRLSGSGRLPLVLIHGVGSYCEAWDGVIARLSDRFRILSFDLRGHGLSKGPEGRLGDVGYRSQYEDDIADFAQLAAREHPGEKRLLVGHSMGGATILRTASLPAYAKNFDGYLALSPFIAPGTAMDRPRQGGWTTVSVPRTDAPELM